MKPNSLDFSHVSIFAMEFEKSQTIFRVLQQPQQQ